MKQTVLRLMQESGAFTAFRLANRHKALILTYHRFSEDGGDGSTSARVLAEQLEYLTAHYWLANLSSLAEYLDYGEALPPGLAVITIDDGYRDAYDIALPVLRRYQVPATVFAVTDFLDGTDWLWTDKIRYLTLHTRAVRLEGGSYRQPLDFKFTDRASRLDAAAQINAYLKTLAEERKQKAVATLADLLEVELPEQAPREFAAMTWEQVREMDAAGVEIGSHTLTHPILTQVGDARLDREMVGSKSRLEAELGRAVSLFCYPNGDADTRVIRAARRAGYRAAVTIEEGFNDKPCNLLALRRVHSETDFARFLQRTSGFEQMKNRLRVALAKTAS